MNISDYSLYNAPAMKYLTRSAERRRPITFAVLLAIAVQSLVPFGYMPKALAEGGFIQLCPQGISDEVMALLHAGHEVDQSGQLDMKHNPMQSEITHSHHSSHDDHGAMNHQSHSQSHSQDHESNSADQLLMPDMHATAVQEVASNDAHYTSWQNDCPYALIVAGTDLSLGSQVSLDVEKQAGYQPTSLIAREFIARLQRKQRSRAPPIQYLS